MTTPPNHREAKCCYYCKHDGSFTDRCGDHVGWCGKYNETTAETGLCDDYEEIL
jgi:hypothetical protein